MREEVSSVSTVSEMVTPRRSVGIFTHTSNLPSSDEPCPWRYKELAQVPLVVSLPPEF